MKRVRQIGPYIAIVAWVVLIPEGVAGKTWHVPDDCATIPAGLDSAAYGDTVLVAPGTYSVAEDGETWIFMKSGVGLLSEDGPDGTVIEFCAVSIGVKFEDCENAFLSGFTVRLGEDPGCQPPMGWTHCVLCRDCTDITVENCIIENAAYGIYVEGESLVWWKPVFRGNTVRHCAKGVACYDMYEPGRPFFEDNTITECGKGAEVFYSCPMFEGNSIEYCSTYGMYYFGATGGNCDRNVIAHNEDNGVRIVSDPPLAAPTFNGSWMPELANDFYDNGDADIWYEHSNGVGVVMALYNYWGGDCPDFQTRIHGEVRYSPWVDASHTEILTEDDCPGATEPSTWGGIKGMFR